eukprot:4082545-Prymnesium_polylepis.1
MCNMGRARGDGSHGFGIYVSPLDCIPADYTNVSGGHKDGTFVLGLLQVPKASTATHGTGTHLPAPIKPQTERSSSTTSAPGAVTILPLRILKTTLTMCVTKPSSSPSARSAQNEGRVGMRVFRSVSVSPPAGVVSLRSNHHDNDASRKRLARVVTVCGLRWTGVGRQGVITNGGVVLFDGNTREITGV